jgi:ABC-type amino acid transport substrate-binding protein
MKGTKIVLLFSIAVLILAASSLSAQDLAMPLDQKIVGPGCGIVKFDGITYRIMTTGTYYLTFSRVDIDHHRVMILPAESQTPPFCEIYLQWDFFPIVELDLGFGDTNTYLLGTETGYVEK